MSAIRVSQIVMDIRPYRVGFLERIAARDDIELTVYSGLAAPGMGAPASLPEVAVPVRRIENRFWPRRPLKVWWQRGALAALRDDSEVVVLQEVVSNMAVWAIRLLHRRYGKRLVLMGFFYRPDDIGRIERVRTLVRRFLRSSASALVAYTDQGREQLLAEGVSPSMVFVNGNTLDTAHLMSLTEGVTATQSEAVRHRLGIPRDAIVVGFLGRLRPIKRVDVAVEAVKLLETMSDRSHILLIIGGGEEAARLAALSDGAPVRIVGQTYDEAEIAELLSVCSLLLMPGSVGLACVHGFANGLPCLTTSDRATTQTPEFAYVENGRNGLIMKTPDAQLFAEAISALTSDSQRLLSLREGAFATARRLDMDRMADAFVAAISYAAHRPDQLPARSMAAKRRSR